MHNFKLFHCLLLALAPVFFVLLMFFLFRQTQTKRVEKIEDLNPSMVVQVCKFFSHSDSMQVFYFYFYFMYFLI